MDVQVIDLKPGVILQEDVYKKTNAPIMRKNTVLTEERIHILELFFIDRVSVYNKTADGYTFLPEHRNETETDERSSGTEIEVDTFLDRYERAVKQYKKMFQNWQGGLKVDAYAVRSLFLPLYELEPTKKELKNLSRYSTKAEYIYHHPVAVSIYSAMLGKRMNLSNGEIIQLGLSGLLSDCGMAKLPKYIFKKEGGLTADEFTEIRKHPVYGYRMIENVPGFSKAAMMGVLQHHEREDGSGYPLQVNETKLHFFARVIAVADMFHALTSERMYRSAKLPYEVLEAMKEEQFGQLDQQMINHFISLVTDLTDGQKIKLNTGEMAEIVLVNEENPFRPVVQIEGSPKRIDLAAEQDLLIEEEAVESYF
ncbi:HD-GYP domain-containing protein [Salisediminibacterium halotolerans]|uniref:HD-GYP domain-containing protein n=1 Tax=Salisediminibacterium halotolerans TaxID=517425 RepID=UPI000EB1CAF3|nr:HD-GYP domain-containing protein [Salisediminibacterium halotolerans]RLJ69745.1 HD domain-containing protein [Actinophytocola xinjiangensis]RPE89803.1 HD domain-containing protein [Salisediminibacterium halotolerans]TWG32639.1 HD domain-containing protein [Salisediminibacterium halotolerans]GEL07549.1 HD family phosphohydrolase [Salisediminibacterium halotolerans]